MKVRRNSLAILAFTLVLALSGCIAGAGTQYSYQNVSVTIAPAITSLAVGTTQQFTATASNAPDFPIWGVLYNSPGNSITGPYGTITMAATDSPTVTFTAPATPPIYTPAQIASGAVNGLVTISAAVSNSGTNLLSYTAGTLTFAITAPVITVGISPTAVSVARNASQQFTAYAVGNLNRTITWQVNGVTGGGTANGTITATGLYTAPAAFPVSGTTITVTAVAQADPTRTASSTITLI